MDRPRASSRPGGRALFYGTVATAVGFALFALSAIVGVFQGHAFTPVGLLFVPLVLVIGGMAAVTVGGVQRLMS